MSSPRARRAAWLTALPLIVGASEAAQAVLDRFTTASYRGAELLAPTHAHVLLGAAGIGGVLVGASLVGQVSSGHRNSTVPLWTFALLPPILFIAQEHVEYWVGHGGLSGSPATQPAFLFGLALQAPFAVAAYAIARVLVRLAGVLVTRRTAGRLAHTTGARGGSAYRDPWTRRVQLGGAHATRGPPVWNAISL